MDRLYDSYILRSTAPRPKPRGITVPLLIGSDYVYNDIPESLRQFKNTYGKETKLILILRGSTRESDGDWRPMATAKFQDLRKWISREHVEVEMGDCLASRSYSAIPSQRQSLQEDESMPTFGETLQIARKVGLSVSAVTYRLGAQISGSKIEQDLAALLKEIARPGAFDVARLRFILESPTISESTYQKLAYLLDRHAQPPHLSLITRGGEGDKALATFFRHIQLPNVKRLDLQVLVNVHKCPGLNDAIATFLTERGAALEYVTIFSAGNLFFDGSMSPASKRKANLESFRKIRTYALEIALAEERAEKSNDTVEAGIDTQLNGSLEEVHASENAGDSPKGSHTPEVHTKRRPWGLRTGKGRRKQHSHPSSTANEEETHAHEVAPTLAEAVAKGRAKRWKRWDKFWADWEAKVLDFAKQALPRQENGDWLL